MNRKEKLAYKRQYYKDHCEEMKAKSKQYNKDHREERRAYDKDRYWNKGKREYDKKYKKTHKEQYKEYNKQYSINHREELKENKKIWNNSHREQVKAYDRKRYKKSRSGVPFHIKRSNKKLEIGNVCACCGLKDIFNLTIDHIISKAMKRKFKKYKNFDIEKPSNLQILCYACNTSKNGHRKHCNLPHDNPEIKKMVTKARRRKSKK